MRLDREVWAAVKAVAAQCGRSAASLVEEALRQEVARRRGEGVSSGPRKEPSSRSAGPGTTRAVTGPAVTGGVGTTETGRRR
jgi:hypothetical protein